MKLVAPGFLLFAIIFMIYLSNAEAVTITQTMEGSVDLQVTHPESSIVGRTFSISSNS